MAKGRNTSGLRQNRIKGGFLTTEMTIFSDFSTHKLFKVNFFQQVFFIGVANG